MGSEMPQNYHHGDAKQHHRDENVTCQCAGSHPFDFGMIQDAYPFITTDKRTL